MFRLRRWAAASVVRVSAGGGLTIRSSRHRGLIQALGSKGDYVEHRYLKIALTLAVALQALFWFGTNLINWDVAQGAVGYVLSQEDHLGYPNHLVPPVTSPLIITVVLLTILVGEAAAGGLALLGTYRLWRARNASPEIFTSAKGPAVLGSGIAVLVWFLLFAVLGGALYQMGQAEGTRGALEGAFRFAGYSFFTLIYLSISEPR